MLTSLGQRLDIALRHLLPLISVLFFVLLGSVTWPLPYAGAIAPSLGLIAVFYWSIYRPDLFRPLLAFGCGVLHDAINFLPLGMTALVFVAVHQLALRQRRFFAGQPFHMLWAGFALVMLLAMAAHWIILSIYNWQLVEFMPILLQGLLSIAIFPLPAWILIRLQRGLLTQG